MPHHPICGFVLLIIARNGALCDEIQKSRPQEEVLVFPKRC
jgi:hypothetical protein